MIGWYVVLVVAVVLAILSLPGAPADYGTCGGWGLFCPPNPRQDTALVALAVGTPLLAIGGAISTALLVPIATHVRSALLTGTIAALTGLCPGAAVIAAIVLPKLS